MTLKYYAHKNVTIVSDDDGNVKTSTVEQKQQGAFSRMNKISNWHIAIDTLVAIIKAQRQNLPKGFKECITMNMLPTKI